MDGGLPAAVKECWLMDAGNRTRNFRKLGYIALWRKREKYATWRFSLAGALPSPLTPLSARL